jgi:prepilin-type N-terminal cleavage/methylation domain-containing protein
MVQNQNVKSNKGFSLIELLVALVIIGVSIMGLMEMSIIVMDNNLRNEIRNKAIETLSNHVSNLTSMNYDNVSEGTSTISDNEKIRNFQKQFTIIDNVTSNATSSKNITSKINWTYRGKSYNYTMDTVVNKE